MRRLITGAAAAMAATALAACSGSSDSTGATSAGSTASSSSNAPATPRMTEAQLWEQSLCSKLDPRKVAKVAGTGYKAGPTQRHVNSVVAVPAFDYCDVGIRFAEHNDRAGGLEVPYGLSAATWSAARWAAYKKSQLRAGAEQFRVNGHEALRTADARYLLYVGDRILTVGGEFGYVRKRVIAEWKLAIPVVKDLNPRPAKVTLPACSKADDSVTAALGGSASVRRDSDAGGELRCGWATRTAYVRVHADNRPAAWPDVVKAMQQRWPNAKAVNGIGAGAVYTDAHGGEPRTLRVATKKRLVFVEGSGGQVNRTTLTAVAKQVVENY